MTHNVHLLHHLFIIFFGQIDCMGVEKSKDLEEFESIIMRKCIVYYKLLKNYDRDVDLNRKHIIYDNISLKVFSFGSYFVKNFHFYFHKKQNKINFLKSSLHLKSLLTGLKTIVLTMSIIMIK